MNKSAANVCAYFYEVLIYSEIDHIHLSSEAQCVSHHLLLVDCHILVHSTFYYSYYSVVNYSRALNIKLETETYIIFLTTIFQF